MFRVISNSCYIVTGYVHNINFNELLWNYEFNFYENLLSLKIKLFTKFLYNENLELYEASALKEELACTAARSNIEEGLEHAGYHTCQGDSPRHSQCIREIMTYVYMYS